MGATVDSYVQNNHVTPSQQTYVVCRSKVHLLCHFPSMRMPTGLHGESADGSLVYKTLKYQREVHPKSYCLDGRDAVAME